MIGTFAMNELNSRHLNYLEIWILISLSFLHSPWRFAFNPLSANLTKWSNILKQFAENMPTNCLSVFDHFVGLALKGLKIMTSSILSFLSNKFISNLYWTAKFLTLYAPIPQNGGQHTQTVRRQSDVSTEWLNLIKWDALRDLVSFVQFKKREKHPWRSVTFSKVAG